MKLKRLTVQGYKSFAGRTEFAFDGGITVVVGPNGSGKSNIADSLRWVLGEQSYSQLRSRRTTDLIFAGSDGRSRTGMAEATLILDNDDGSLPIEYQEVAITRRAYRSGENEYYLNGERVRLRDVVELLAAGGLNRLTYAVVGQGLVDAALSWSPIERRRLFEEAAGISLYQQKREESLRRLEETGANVLRVHDVMRELEPQLRRLSTQAEQAARYAELQAELRQLQTRYYSLRLRQALAQARAADERSTYLEYRLRRQVAELDELEGATARLTSLEHDKQGQIESWQREGERLRGALALAERQLAVLGERERSMRDRLAGLEREVDLLAREQAETAQEETTAAAELSELQTARDSVAAEVTSLETEEARQLSRRRAGEGRMRTLRQELAGASAQAAEGASRRSLADQRLAELRSSLADGRAQADALRAERIACASALAEAGENVGQALVTLQASQSLHEERRAIERQGQEALGRLRHEVQAAEEEEQRLRARASMLSRLQQESYYPGVRSVLELAQQEGEASGILGPVSSLLHVPVELEQAIEAALGGRLQQLVVQSWQHAERAIAHLKKRRAGRVTFLPLDTIRPPSALQLPRLPGVLGLASDMVEVEPGLDAVRQFMLNRVVIVQYLQLARVLLDRLHGSYTIATLEGEVAQSSGSVTGGGERQPKNAILERQRERRAIPEQLRAARQRLQDLGERLRGEQGTYQAVVSALAKADDEQQGARAAYEQAQRREARLRLELQQAEERLRWHSERLEAQVREAQAQEAAATAAAASAEEGSRRAGDLDRELRALEAEMASADDGSAARLQEKRTLLATLQERLAHSRGGKEAAGQRLERLRGRAREQEAQRESLAAGLEEVRRERQEASEARKEYEQALAGLQRSLDPARLELARLQEQRRALEREERQRRQWHLEFSHACSEAGRAAGRMQDAVSALEAEAVRELGDELLAGVRHVYEGDDSEDGSLPSCEERIDDLRRRCRHIGLVNQKAPEEYAAAAERYGFLHSQAEDLEKAAVSLRRVIGELEQTMHKRFASTFADVSKRFSAYFQELFAGGGADLHLIDPDDLSDAGVEISVRPPGKRGQELSALSGGERALTSCALLFALLEASKTPFCFMDEVDAMLDEANVGRFRRLLQRLSQQVQFILISHNRATIEAASIIYGVTMGNDGTSHVLSLRLDGDGGEKAVALA